MYTYSVSCQLWAHLLWAPEYTYLVLGKNDALCQKLTYVNVMLITRT